MTENAMDMERAHRALTELRAALAAHGIVLPELSVNLVAAVSGGVAAVHLGDATLDDAQKLSKALNRAAHLT